MRDDFTAATKKTLAKRVGYRCSSPNCRRHTSGPHSVSEKTLNIGVAAHITAAAYGGPRFSETLTPEARRELDNGIWLCQNRAKLVDNDVMRYSESVLRDWKTLAEDKALKNVEYGSEDRLQSLLITQFNLSTSDKQLVVDPVTGNTLAFDPTKMTVTENYKQTSTILKVMTLPSQWKH